MSLLKLFKKQEKISDSEWIQITELIEEFKSQVDWKNDFTDESIDYEKMKTIGEKIENIWSELSNFFRTNNYQNDPLLNDLLGYIYRIKSIFNELIVYNIYKQKDLISKSDLFSVISKNNSKRLCILWDKIKYSVKSLVDFDESTNGNWKRVTPLLIQEQLTEFNGIISDILKDLPEYYQQEWELSLKKIIIKELENFSKEFYNLNNKNWELEELIKKINEGKKD